MSNFSFYYAHHLSTIEGGMVCTDDAGALRDGADAPLARHGARVHATSRQARLTPTSYPDLNPDFIFAFPAYNVRSTEINAVIGRSQLPRLDANNAPPHANLELFLDNLDPARYRTDFATEGSCNYAFTLVLREPDDASARPGDATLRRARRRVPPRHLRRRQPGPPAVPAPAPRRPEAWKHSRGSTTSISSASTSAIIPDLDRKIRLPSSGLRWART